MNEYEARALIDDLETELQDRLEGAGMVLLITDDDGVVHYMSNLERPTALALLKQFVTRHTQ